MRKRTPKHRKPTIEAFRTLLFFDEEQAVTAVAGRLNVTQPVITRRLEVFETSQACGAILLHRTGNSLELTSAARGALPAIRELVERYDQILGYLGGKRNAPQLVRIGVGSFTAQFYLPRALAMLQGCSTPCDVETQIARGEDRILGVLQGRFHLAIVSHEMSLIREIEARGSKAECNLKIDPLVKLEMGVLARKGTEEADQLQGVKERPVPLQKLERWNLVGLDHRSGIRRQLEQQFTNPDHLHFLAEGGGWMAAKEFVRQGIGVAIVPLITLTRDDRNDFVVRRLSEDLAVTYSMIYRSEPLSPAQEELKDALEKVAQALKTEAQQKSKEWV
jgi:DNA-binding transcriptional LysR family regulator